FVFSVYLTDVVGDGRPEASAALGFAVGAAGFVIALLAPVIGQRADATGGRKLATGVWTACTIAAMAGLFSRRGGTAYRGPGLALLAVGSVAAELAQVSYNAMLDQVTTPATIGRVSGLGWAGGYRGVIVLWRGVYYGFVAGDGPTAGLLGLP